MAPPEAKTVDVVLVERVDQGTLELVLLLGQQILHTLHLFTADVRRDTLDPARRQRRAGGPPILVVPLALVVATCEVESVAAIAVITAELATPAAVVAAVATGPRVGPEERPCSRRPIAFAHQTSNQARAHTLADEARPGVGVGEAVAPLLAIRASTTASSTEPDKGECAAERCLDQCATSSLQAHLARQVVEAVIVHKIYLSKLIWERIGQGLQRTPTEADYPNSRQSSKLATPFEDSDATCEVAVNWLVAAYEPSQPLSGGDKHPIFERWYRGVAKSGIGAAGVEIMRTDRRTNGCLSTIWRRCVRPIFALGPTWFRSGSVIAR